MWRRENSASVAVAAWLVLSGAAMAYTGFSTNAWPSESYPYQHVAHGAQANSAAVERCIAVGVTPFTNYWDGYLLGRKRSKLVNAKLNFRAVITNYARPYLAGANGSFDGWLASNTLASLRWTESDLLSTVGASNNYFSSTPYMGLDSHPYGYRHIPAIASNLVWSIAAATLTTNVIGGRSSGGLVISTSSWADAYAKLQAAFTNDTLSYPYAQQRIGGSKTNVTGITQWDIYGEHIQVEFESTAATNWGHSDDLYFASTTNADILGSYAGSVFDGYTDGAALTQVRMATNAENSEAKAVWAAGADYYTNAPPIPPEPTLNGTYTAHGFAGLNATAFGVLRWDGTNGFRFR